MSVSIQDLLALKARKYSTTTDSEAFMEDFRYALVRVQGDMGHRSSVAFDVPESLEGTIDVDDEHFGTISDGVDYYLHQSPQWAREDKAEVAMTYMQSLRSSHGISTASVLSVRVGTE